MEEEKKELETTNTEAVAPEAAPAPEAPAEPVQEEKPAEAPVETIESLDDEPVESLDEPESLDEGEVIIEGQEEAAPEAAPAPSEEVPVVPKATENPVLEHPEAAPAQEEKKPEPVKEEKKEDPEKKGFFETNKNLVKLIILGVVVLAVGLGINFALGTFNGEEIEEEDEEEEAEPVTPATTKFDLSKAGDVVKPFELYGTCGTSFIVSLNKSDFSTSTINDLDKQVVTSIILSKFDGSQEKITNAEFQEKAKELFVLTGDYVPAESGNLITADGSCVGYKFDSSTNEFIKDTTSTCDSACGPDAKYAVMSKAMSGTKTDGTVTLEYKVLYGEVTEEGLKVYSDSEHANLVNTYNKKDDGSYEVSEADYSKGAGFKFVFKESGNKYLFVKSEIVK